MEMTNIFKCKPPAVHFTIRNRVPYNKLLTNLACSSRTGEYWPSVVFVRTSLRSVRTATTSGQYSPVWPSGSVSKRLIFNFDRSTWPASQTFDRSKPQLDRPLSVDRPLFSALVSSGGNCHLFTLRKVFVELQSLCSWLMEMQLFLKEEILMMKSLDCLSWKLWHVVLSLLCLSMIALSGCSGVTPCLTHTGVTTDIRSGPRVDRENVAHWFTE